MTSTPPETEPAPALRVTYAFVLVDLSGSAEVPAALLDIRDALEEQANRDVADFWGGAYTFRIAKGASDRIAGEVAINIRASIPEAPGALGYHYVTNGVPDIEIGLNVIEGLTKGSACLAAVISHEVCETIGDPGANQWVDRGDGIMRAKELCDTVEDTTYLASNGVEVSNFLLPAAFVAGASAPYDMLQVLTGQNDLTPGGYDIQCSSPTDVAQVTQHAARHGDPKKMLVKRHAPFEGMHLARKKHPYSRTSRRGVSL